MDNGIFTPTKELLIPVLTKVFLPLFLVMFGILLFFLYLYYRKKQKFLQANIEEVDRMSGTEFELFCKSLLEELGFEVDMTPSTGDYGVDLIARKDGKSTAVQCKRWNKKVGVKAIQEVIAGKQYYNTDEASIITNNYFTKNAIQLAKKTGVELIDRDLLVDLIIEVKKRKTAN